MEKLLINTPQNVQIEYRLASVGTRLIAAAIDYAIIVSYIVLIYKLFQAFFSGSHDSWTYFGAMALFTLPALFYHFLLETFLGGQTVGKLAVKTKVLKVDGSRASVYEYFIRWALSLVDIWILSGLIGLVSIILSNKSQRLGDLAANTTVVSLKPQLKLIETVYEDLTYGYEITYPEVINLSDKDINVIKESFHTAMGKEEYWVIAALAEKVKSVMGLKEINGSHIEFIKTVIQDHYHYFKKNKPYYS